MYIYKLNARCTVRKMALYPALVYAVVKMTCFSFSFDDHRFKLWHGTKGKHIVCWRLILSNEVIINVRKVLSWKEGEGKGEMLSFAVGLFSKPLCWSIPPIPLPHWDCAIIAWSRRSWLWSSAPPFHGWLLHSRQRYGKGENLGKRAKDL
jgi:hypothetical protein